MSNPAAKPQSADGKNLVSIFLETAGKRKNDTAAKYKKDGKWISMAWEEMEQLGRRYAAGLIALGVQPGDKVAILGMTRLEWLLSELGAQMAGATSVPIYHSNTPEEVEYVANNSDATFAFAENDEQLAKFQEVKDKLKVKHVVRMEGKGDGDWVLDLESLAEKGDAYAAENPTAVDDRVAGIDPNGPATFIYTSGTTGPPKGVVLTHANWAYEAQAVADLNLVRADDEQLFWLPLAHSFAQLLKAAWFQLGHEMAFAESIDKLIANVGEVKPTVMACVPRIFEKVFTKVISGGQSAPGIKGKLFNWAMDHFDKYVEAKQAGRNYGGLGFALANKLVFSKVGDKLSNTFGGRINFFISGGAPLSPKIAYFFDIAGIKILEGYGLTETSAATTVNRPNNIKIGTVGAPLPGTEIKIAEDGEIMIRGGGVMKEYYGLPDATKEAIEPDGWFHSGDIGVMDSDGYVKITDRKKDIIVTAGGKNVSPQNLENELKTHPLVSQVVVHGDKRKFLSALITFDEETVKAWCEQAGVSFSTYAEMAQNEQLRAEIQKGVDVFNQGLPSYETIKKFHLLDHDLSVESGEMTASMKVKRRVVEKENQSVLDGFYGGEAY